MRTHPCYLNPQEGTYPCLQFMEKHFSYGLGIWLESVLCVRVCLFVSVYMLCCC